MVVVIDVVAIVVVVVVGSMHEFWAHVQRSSGQDTSFVKDPHPGMQIGNRFSRAVPTRCSLKKAFPKSFL